MVIRLCPMSAADAAAVAAWHYDPPYDFYDWTADPDDLALILDDRARRGRFYSAYENGRLVCFFEFQLEGGTVVVGLGLRPDLTGLGLGRQFLESGLEFARTAFAPRCFRLSVARFNERAIRLYERLGFREAGERHTRTFAKFGDHEFMQMEMPA